MARTKGTPNKPKRALIALLQEKYPGYHPVIEMAKVANDPDADPKMRFDANKEVAQYIEPKRKAVEYRDSEGNSMAPAFVMTVNAKTKR